METQRETGGEPGIEDRLARVENALARRDAGEPQGNLLNRALKYLPLFAMSNLFVAAPAFLISIAVAYFTFVQAEATQKMQVASVWPRVDYVTSNRTQDGTPRITLSLVNKGVGPALVRGMEIRYRDQPHSSLAGLLKACCSENPEDLSFSLGSINGEVLRPGEEAMFAQIDPAGVTPEVWERFNRERLNLKFRICYCSVFDDCWVAGWDSAEPRTVKRCPADWVQYYGFPQAEPDRR